MKEKTDLAVRAGHAMFADDRFAATLGIDLEAVGPGVARLSMTVRPDMAQAHGTCHGGATFTLADMALAVACNSHNERAVAHMCSITFVAPAAVGDVLVAEAQERVRRGRSGIYDVTVSRQDGSVLAEFRGHSRTIGGALVA